jgi:hypothetical protein
MGGWEEWEGWEGMDGIVWNGEEEMENGDKCIYIVWNRLIELNQVGPSGETFVPQILVSGYYY